jgi:hypothetical protein
MPREPGGISVTSLYGYHTDRRRTGLDWEPAP